MLFVYIFCYFQVKYHENYEKMKGTKIDVADDPETKRLMANTQNQSMAQYHGEQKKKEEQDQHREAKQQQQAASGNKQKLHFFRSV